MMRSSTTGAHALALAILALGTSVTPALAITKSSSGKTLAMFAENPSAVGTGTYSVTIVKGQKKQALVIESTMSVFGGATTACISDVRVNGVLANPSTGGFNLVCTGTTTEMMSQVVSGTYWLDIDDAELSSPGSFYGQPLNVVVKTNADVAGLSGSVSVVVRMEKK